MKYRTLKIAGIMAGFLAVVGLSFFVPGRLLALQDKQKQNRVAYETVEEVVFSTENSLTLVEKLELFCGQNTSTQVSFLDISRANKDAAGSNTMKEAVMREYQTIVELGLLPQLEFMKEDQENWQEHLYEENAVFLFDMEKPMNSIVVWIFSYYYDSSFVSLFMEQESEKVLGFMTYKSAAMWENKGITQETGEAFGDYLGLEMDSINFAMQETDTGAGDSSLQYTNEKSFYEIRNESAGVVSEEWMSGMQLGEIIFRKGGEQISYPVAFYSDGYMYGVGVNGTLF